MTWIVDRYAKRLNYGRSWRNLQFLWWGWPRRWRSSFWFARCRPPLDATWRWTMMIGPLEIRRWAEDWRDQRKRLIRERGGVPDADGRARP